MAIADAIREVVRVSDSEENEIETKDSSNLGRRGHLRAVPS
jgi:hypothetical protein